MSDDPTATIAEHFSELEDPRADSGKRHLLLDIIVIAICATICGADDWVAVELFGQVKEEWLRTLLKLPHGIPAHDTFGRVFRVLDPEQFQQSFRSWIEAVEGITKGQVVAVDGKTLRRSHDRPLGKAAIQMVSAWATENRLVLGQTKVADGSNEITAIPELLEVLDLAGCIVTVDAIGCQRAIAQAVVDQDADYLFALKKNQGHLYSEVAGLFDYAEEIGFRDVEYDWDQMTNKGHGRLEVRQCWTISAPDFMSYVRQFGDWPEFNTIVKVHAERSIGTEVTRKTRLGVDWIPTPYHKGALLSSQLSTRLLKCGKQAKTCITSLMRQTANSSVTIVPSCLKRQGGTNGYGTGPPKGSDAVVSLPAPDKS